MAHRRCNNIVIVVQLAAAAVRASDNDLALCGFSGGGATPLVDKESANARHCSARKLIPSKLLSLLYYNIPNDLLKNIRGKQGLNPMKGPD
jgi:hypothetical protein